MRGQQAFDLTAGEAAKEAGQTRAAGADRAWTWRGRALDAIRDLAATGVPFTADDVIAVTGLPDVGSNRNNAVGSVFTTAARRGWIVKTGHYRASRRVLSHARVIAVWVGAPDWDPPM
jgi:hypothetical protein